MGGHVGRTCLPLLLIAAVSTSACGGADSEERRAAPRPPAYQLHTCFVPRANERVVRFTDAAGNRIAGVLLGRGRVGSGVVLAHQLNDSLCSWLQYGRSLGADGYLVLAFDFEPAPLPPQIEAAAGELRRRGARDVVLAGASMGGTASLAAAVTMRPAPAAVASLSGPAQFGSVDALAAVRTLDVPVLFVVGAQDGSFADGARALYRAAAARTKSLQVLPTYRHGTGLLTEDAGPEAPQLLSAFIARHAPVAARATPAAAQGGVFAYDSGAPLDIRVGARETRGGATVEDVTFAAPGGRVGAYLVRPVSGPAKAAILYLHGYGRGLDNTQFVDEAIAAAGEGVVSLLPEGLFPWRELPNDPAGDRRLVVRQVVESRRALDVLAARAGAAARKLAVVGHDYGAMYGALLAGTDKRAQAYVLMAPDATFGNWLTEYFGTTGNYAPSFAAIDPIAHVDDAAPAAVFFQFAEYDVYVPRPTALRIYRAASEPKLMRVYSSDHKLDERAAGDRMHWLREQLGLGR